ncbi:hypothetical protein ACLKA6_010094 [Drosophila palustris]
MGNVWLYTAIVRPILLYGIFVWWPALSKASTLKQLNKVQRMAEVCIACAMNTTSSEALDAILNLPPITFLVIISKIYVSEADSRQGKDFYANLILC